MTHLRIEQNTTGIEEVSSAVIKKLYDLVYSGTLDNTSNLLGRLHTTSTYQSYVDYLTGLYPNLYITANKYYMSFADPVVEQMAATKWGDGVGVTATELATVTGTLSVTGFNFYLNTDVTSLDDLLYFTGISKISLRFARDATNLVSVTTPSSLRILSDPEGGDPSFFGVFRGCTSLTNVTLNEGLTTIMNNAFMGCTSLLTIDIPSTVMYIGTGTLYDPTTANGNAAFSGCTSLTTVTGGENVILLGYGTFNNCTLLQSLGDIDFSLLTYLGADCFHDCQNLQFGSISIPCVTRIANSGTFYRCAGLTSISLPNCTSIGDAANFKNEGNFRECTGLTSVTLSSNITKIGSYAFWHDANLATISGNISPTEIGQSAFSGCTSLPSSSIDLSNATSIAQNAFYGCTSLTSVDLSSLTTAGGSNNNGIFQNCTGLTTVTNLNACGSNMFRGCSQLSNVSLTSNCTTIGLSAFLGCPLTSIDLSNCTSIGGWAFLNLSNLTNITSLSNVTSIEDAAFNNAPINTQLNLPNLTSLGKLAFYGSDITSITSLGSITSIGLDTFRGNSNLTTLDLSTTPITSIGTASFAANNSLTTVKLPSTLTSISGWAFDCMPSTASLRTYYIYATTPPTLNATHSLTASSTFTLPAAIYVPNGYGNAYKTASVWSLFASVIYEMPAS